MEEFDISVDLKININWISPADDIQEKVIRDIMQIGVDAQTKALEEEIRTQIENGIKDKIRKG